MPERPGLGDFFRLRFGVNSAAQLLPSARMARDNGLGEKVIMPGRWAGRRNSG
jgi:hypothetical protein